MMDAETVVRELIARVAAERGHPAPAQLRHLNTGGGNYTSALFTASIDNLNLFAKVAIIGEKMRAIFNAEKLYKVEDTVYNEIVDIYKTLMMKRNARPFRFPKIYASSLVPGSEALVMEDLSKQGYKTMSRYDSMDWRFAAAAVSKLATFHALSFAFEKEQPKEFAALAERLKHEPTKHTPETEEGIKAAVKKMIEGAIQVVKDEHKGRLINVLKDLKGIDKLKSPLSRTVLVHGDYRSNNLMFKEQDGSLDMMVVDYQLVHSGCPASDLLYFMFLGTDQQFRRKHFYGLLQHYHEELGAALGVLGMDVEQEYPRKVFDKEVKEMIPCALQYSVVVLPLVTVEESAAPQMAGDADLGKLALAPNQLFAQRFQALVEDCADWGAI